MTLWSVARAGGETSGEVEVCSLKESNEGQQLQDRWSVCKWEELKWNKEIGESRGEKEEDLKYIG